MALHSNKATLQRVKTAARACADDRAAVAANKGVGHAVLCATAYVNVA